MSLDEDSSDKEYSDMLAANKRQRDLDDYNHEMAGLETGRAKRFGNDRQGGGLSGARKGQSSVYADTDAFYMALINSGELGGFIASEVFDGKSDTEIATLAAKIETETGLSLTDYASGIIGPNAAQRLAGESDADYQRRIFNALTEEMIDPATGQIKAQYANDPFAQILRDDAAYQRILLDVEAINRDGPSIQADVIVQAHKDTSYTAAEISGEHIEIDSYKTGLRNGQDGHRDDSTFDANAIDRNSGFFGSEDVTAKASEAARTEFNDKARFPESNSATLATTVDLSVGTKAG